MTGVSAARDVVWVRSSQLAAVEEAGRVVLVHLDHLDRPAQILVGSSAAIWRAIDGQRDKRAIVGVVASEFGLDEQTISADVAHFLDDLHVEGLVKAVLAGVEVE